MKNYICEIWGSHGGEEVVDVLGYVATFSPEDG
jgi:hypothetical protein